MKEIILNQVIAIEALLGNAKSTKAEAVELIAQVCDSLRALKDAPMVGTAFIDGKRVTLNANNFHQQLGAESKAIREEIAQAREELKAGVAGATKARITALEKMITARDNYMDTSCQLGIINDNQLAKYFEASAEKTVIKSARLVKGSLNTKRARADEE